MSGFPPQFRAELKFAVNDCIELSPEGDCSTGPHGPMGEWDVSRVNDMNRMFNELTFFNQSLSKWDVSRVTDMGAMFNDAKSFDQDLSKWDVSRVTDIHAMFAKAHAFNRDLSKWDVSRVTDMGEMFAYANSFQQTLCGAAWVNSNACKSDMFEQSPGSISKAVCGVCVLCVHRRFACLFLLFLFLPPHSCIGTSKRSRAHAFIHVHPHRLPGPTSHTRLSS